MAARLVAEASGSVDNLWHLKPPFCFCERINYGNQTMHSDAQNFFSSFICSSLFSWFSFFFKYIDSHQLMLASHMWPDLN